MADNKLVITETGFLTEFLNQHTQRTDRPFCFILGAGASQSSGIPTGAEMAQVWLRELHEAENFDGLSLEEWATGERLDIEGFTIGDAANFYPQLYSVAMATMNRLGTRSLRVRWRAKSRATVTVCSPTSFQKRRIEL